MKISSLFYNKIDSLYNYASRGYNKLQSKIDKICCCVTVPENPTSIYDIKGLSFPDYNLITVDISKKGWQHRLKFNSKNTHPCPTEYAYEKTPYVKYVIDKPKSDNADKLFCQTTKSTPMIFAETAPKGIMIDNFTSPGGTIAIEGTLDDTFYTKKLYQCVGVSITDKQKNLQKFMHYYIYSDETDSLRLFKFLTRGMKEPEITLIPGCKRECNLTLEFLTDAFNNCYHNLDIKHKHVPNILNVDNGIIGIHNGELFCCRENPELITSINPLDKIIYI